MKEDYNNFKSNAYNVLIETVAGWSSLEARRAHNPKVTGSNPVPATLAQLAQLVEQRTENPRVSGSIPELGILRKPEKWDISSVGRALDF